MDKAPQSTEPERYGKPAEGEWVQPIRKGYKMRCCDCDLVHRMDFRVYKGRVQFRVYRDQKATLECRSGYGEKR